MTQEQKKVIRKCEAMLKRAFPDKTGYVKMNFVKDSPRVKTHEYWDVE